MWGRIEEYSILVEHVPDQGGMLSPPTMSHLNTNIILGTQLSTQEGRNLGESYPQATGLFFPYSQSIHTNILLVIVATETYLRLYVIIGQHILDRAQKWRKYWVALRECNYEGVQAAQCNRAYALYYASVWAAKALANVLDEEAAKLDPLVSVDSLMRDLYRCALHLHLTFDRCSPHIDQLLEWIRAQAQGS